MQKKKIITLAFAFLIITCVLAYFVFLKLKLFSKNQNSTQEQGQQIAIENKIISEDASPLKITVDYPFISGQNEFNNLAKTLVDKEISDFKTNSLENDQAVKETNPETYAKYPREYDLIISYQAGQVNSNLASVVFEISGFTGGAHPYTYQKSINYDFKNKKELGLADVFAGQENYLQKISDYCIPDLTKQIETAVGAENKDYIDFSWIKTGAGANAENFAIFMLNNDDTITFYFPQYQVAPYAYGDFKVTMPR